jgi:hypothetical protein
LRRAADRRPRSDIIRSKPARPASPLRTPQAIVLVLVVGLVLEPPF